MDGIDEPLYQNNSMHSGDIKHNGQASMDLYSGWASMDLYSGWASMDLYSKTIHGTMEQIHLYNKTHPGTKETSTSL